MEKNASVLPSKWHGTLLKPYPDFGPEIGKRKSSQSDIWPVKLKISVYPPKQLLGYQLKAVTKILTCLPYAMREGTACSFA